jgi:hypothetical protein
LDNIIVFSEAQLRRILKSYADYYDTVRTGRSLHKDAPISRPIHQTGTIRSHPIRTHRSLDKDAPICRPVQRTGVITSNPILGGLHHRYIRI